MKKPFNLDIVNTNKPYGYIVFRHTNGTTHSYYSYVNELTNDRLSAFDTNAPTVGNTVCEVSGVFKSIHSHSEEVLHCEGKLACLK